MPEQTELEQSYEAEAVHEQEPRPNSILEQRQEKKVEDENGEEKKERVGLRRQEQVSD